MNNEAALFIGQVESVRGGIIEIRVNKSKNTSHSIFEGEVVKGVSVGSFVKIRKGFDELIGKIEEEYITEDKLIAQKDYRQEKERIKRVLRVRLLGYFEKGVFIQGIKEFPLIDNQVFSLKLSEFNKVHNFIKKVDGKPDIPLEIGFLSSEDEVPIQIGVNSLFASHIGIFGNTGSGKSYSLASLYYSLFKKFGGNTGFRKNAKFLLIDFNGEYSGEAIYDNKRTIKLSTRKRKGIPERNKLPLNESTLIDVEVISILANATEKTQKPFLKRTVEKYEHVAVQDDPLSYFKGILRNKLKGLLQFKNKEGAFEMLDYFFNILKDKAPKFKELLMEKEIEWHDKKHNFKPKGSDIIFNLDNIKDIEKFDSYKLIGQYEFPENIIEKFIDFLYVQIIEDLLINRARNEHISPAINKLKSKVSDLKKVIDFQSNTPNIFESSNFVVLDLNDVNIDIKKTIPLLVCHKVYSDQKEGYRKSYSTSLNIIIDEAHNILSYNSNRESETWKDYRLEVFEEIIKEGRKFGTFLTIASQRPFDISTTIISQLHNYFLHRLINNKDIEAIQRTVSYLDKVSFDSLSILPTGTCVLAGIAAQIPVIIKMKKLPYKRYEPNSNTIRLTDFWGNDEKGLEETEEFPPNNGEDLVEVKPIDDFESGNDPFGDNEDDLPF